MAFKVEGKAVSAASPETALTIQDLYRGSDDHLYAVINGDSVKACYLTPEGGYTGPYADGGKQRAPIPSFDSYVEQLGGSTFLFARTLIRDLLVNGVKLGEPKLNGSGIYAYNGGDFLVKVTYKRQLLEVSVAPTFTSLTTRWTHTLPYDSINYERLDSLIDFLRKGIGAVLREKEFTSV